MLPLHFRFWPLGDVWYLAITARADLVQYEGFAMPNSWILNARHIPPSPPNSPNFFAPLLVSSLRGWWHGPHSYRLGQVVRSTPGRDSIEPCINHEWSGRPFSIDAPRHLAWVPLQSERTSGWYTKFLSRYDATQVCVVYFYDGDISKTRNTRAHTYKNIFYTYVGHVSLYTYIPMHVHS